MKRSQRRLAGLLIAVPLFVVAAALLYMAGMAALEGSPRGFWQSVEWAAETLSTTGYGADSHWSHPLMVIFVVFVQFVGVFLVFLIIPIYLVPFLEERFEERLPRRADPALHDHVVIYRHGPSVETLIERLRTSPTPPLVIERDEAAARALVEHGTSVVFAREDDDPLDLCNLDAARAIVANGHDEENGPLILRARQRGFRGDIYALVEEPVHRRPMELAGATAAYTPRHILAAALAARASDKISPQIWGMERMHGIELRQFRIRRGGPARRTAHDILRETGELTVAGVWARGVLHTAGFDKATLPDESIVLLLGTHEAFAVLEGSDGLTPIPTEGAFLVAGFGEVGAKVHELLTDAGETVRSIDRHPRSMIDVAGNVLDPDVLRRGGIETARSVILALDSDDATMFATVIAREVAPDVPIIARVNHARNVANIFAAGADFALSISEVSGQMLSHRLLRDAPTPGAAGHLEVARVARDLRNERLDCAIVALERNGELLGPHATGTADATWICGASALLRTIS